MSLFIGGLSFGDNLTLMNEVRVGVLSGSIVAAIVGYTVLRMASIKDKAEEDHAAPQPAE
jgi:NhaA family Na+:H+ antiporter